MKKVVVSSLISVFILILIAGSFIYLQRFRSENSNSLDVVPTDVAWLLSCDPSSGDFRQLANTGFFSGADTIRILKDWKTNLLKFDSLSVNTAELRKIFSDEPFIVSGHVTGPRTFSALYIARLKSTSGNAVLKIVQKLLGTTQNGSSRNYNGADIREFTRQDGTIQFAYVISKGIFIGSATPYLVEDALRQQRSDKIKSPATRLVSLLRDAGKKTVLAIRYEGFERWIQTHLATGVTNLSELQRLGDWTVLRIDIHPNLLTFSGSTTTIDSTSFLQLFRFQRPVICKLRNNLLSRTSAFVSWGFSQPESFFQDLGRMLDPGKLNEWEKLSVDSMRRSYATWMGNEMGVVVLQPVIGQADGHFIALATITSEDSCVAALKKLSKYVTNSGNALPEEMYNGSVIRMVPGLGLMNALYGPLYSKVNKFYYTIIDSTLLVTNQVSSLRAYINDYRLGNLLKEDTRYKALKMPLPSSSNLFFYCSIPQSEKLFSSVAAPYWTSWIAQYSQNLKSWNGIMFSASSQSGVYKTTASLGYYPSTAQAPKLEWETAVDTTIIAGPFYPAKSNLLFVQDQKMMLYAISLTGEIKWKKQLESTIKGEVHGLDLYNQGEMEYLFNTYSFIYRLNASGESSSNYPLRLAAAASSGMALVTWETGSYPQYFIPCLNMRMYGFELTGKPAVGYSTYKLRDVIREIPVVLTTLQGLLVRSENSSGYFINRKGALVYTVKQDIFFAPGTSYIEDTSASGGYAWITPMGKLIQIGKDGIAETITDLSNGDSITGAVRIDLNGDKIQDWLFTLPTGLRGITSEGVSLFVYSADNALFSPVVHVDNGKEFFAASEENRIYVFNRNGSLFEGFPVSGNGIPVFSSTEEKNYQMLFKTGTKSIRMLLFR